MRAGTTLGRSQVLAVACILAAAACSSDNKAGGSSDASTPDSGTTVGNDSSTTGGGDDSSTTSGGDDSGVDAGIPTGDGGKPPAPKELGSPCTGTTVCETTLSCNLTLPNGICTKACMTDADCGGTRIPGVCINSLCLASCVSSAATDAGATDAGPPKSPCKNKAFDCESVPGETVMVCVLAPDAGADNDGGAAEGGSTQGDAPAGTADASAD